MDEFLLKIVDACIRKKEFDANSAQISSNALKNANQQPIFQCDDLCMLMALVCYQTFVAVSWLSSQ